MEYYGKNIEVPFEEEGHSPFALKSLIKLPMIGEILDGDLQAKLEIEIDEAYKKSFCCSRKYVVKKLFTNEDPILLHKTLGFLSICSFLYRYFYVFPREGNLGLNGSWFDHLTMALHMALSASSLIFHVLPYRILARPLVIWNEYRLHAIIFSLRCVSTYLMGLYYPYQNTEMDNLVQFVFIMSHHLVVDEITRRVGPGDLKMTTIRGKEVNGGKSTNELKSHRSVLLFYAFYQFCLLGGSLVPSARLADLGYNGLIAIQSSAFLMTLFRKGLIRWWTHAFWYTLSLALSQAVMCAVLPAFWFYPKVAFMFNLRINFGIDKYIIWTIYFLVSLPIVENFVCEQFT
jgi:hypothetical protein